MNFFKKQTTNSVPTANNGEKGFGVTWGKDCENAAVSKSVKWKHCNPKSEEDKLEARQMVYELYNKKEASGVKTNTIIGEIARELGLSRIVAEGCYKFEKARLDPQASTSTDTANSPYSEFLDEKGLLKKKHQLRPDQHGPFEEFKQNVWQTYHDTLKKHNNRVPGGAFEAVAKEMQIPESVVKAIHKSMKTSKDTAATSKDEQQTVYEAVCKLQEKKCKEEKIIEKVSEKLSFSGIKTKYLYSCELNDLATEDPRSFFYKHFDASIETVEQSMDLKMELTVQNQITLSYLEVADNFTFVCKSNDHKTAKLRFVLKPTMREKNGLLGNIHKHMKLVHGVDAEEIRSRLTLEQIREQYKVDDEVRRRVAFLYWAFDNSPKALGHIVAVLRCSSAIASTQSSSSPLDDNQTSTRLLPEFPGISEEHAWVFCFFIPGTVNGTFRCRLPHQTHQNVGVVFCNGGYKLHETLKHHLNTHDIKGNYGKFNTEFTDKSGVTIELNAVPDETRELIKQLLEPTLPDISSISSTISDQDLQEMKVLTDALPESFYASFCCFKPVHSDLQCLLPHTKRKSSKLLTFDYKQNANDIELLNQKIKTHLFNGHNFTINSLAEREWVSDGVNYTSLKQMPIEMQKYIYDLNRQRLTVQSTLVAPGVPLTPELAAQLKPSLPDNASPFVEMAVIMSVPHSFFEMYNSEKELQECFLFLDSIEELIQNIDDDTFFRFAEVYHIFAQVPSTSKFDYIDRILYGGFATTFARFQAHANNAILAYENRVPHDNPKLYNHMADFWNNGIDVFFGQLRKNMTNKQGAFSEYAVISFLQSLAQNDNHLHGNRTPFIKVFDKYKITHEQTVKIGAALLIDYHQKQKRKFHLLQPIPFDHSNMKPNPDARLTLTDMLKDISIPSFRLSDSVVDIKLHCSYALHLFVSLFTIRARLACYHLSDPTFLHRLQIEDEDSFNEAYDLIESVFSQVQCTVDDCVEWAYGIWKRVFVTNVLVATEQPDFERRFPASAETYEVNLKFVTSAALLLAECVYAQGFTGNGDEAKVREAAAAIFRRNSKSARGQLPPFSRVSKFSDLRNTDTSPKLRHLSNLPQFDAGTVVPIEPYQDMEPTRSFLVAAAQLRAFNYKNILNMPSLFEPKHEFRFPVFLGSLNFIKLV